MIESNKKYRNTGVNQEATISSTPAAMVIDAVMGTGKSRHMIKKLNAESEDGPYLIILPTLEEITRYQEACPELDFQAPEDSKGTKKADLLRLLTLGKNILTTHSMFKKWDEAIAGAIDLGGYHNIIDEETGCLKPLKITVDTINDLLDLQYISLDATTGRVFWDYKKAGSDYQGAKEHQYLRSACETGAVYQYCGDKNNKGFFVWEVPYQFFQVGKSYTIMTYRFESSELAAYFRSHEIAYNVTHLDPEREAAIKSRAKSLITFKDPGPKAANLLAKGSLLTHTGYKRMTAKDAKTIRNGISNALRKDGVRPDEMIYTCPKIYSTSKGRKSKSHMAIPGYANTDKTKKYGWLAFNTKGTNEYDKCTNVVYLQDVYPNLSVEKYLNDKGAGWNRNDYALSTMLQFIWRSAIRRGKPIDLYVPSGRMRQLLVDWLEAA